MRNMISFCFGFVLSAFVYLGLFDKVAVASGPSQQPVMENASDCVSPDDLPKLKSAALAGDGAAAWRLSREYNFCAETMEDGEYWAHIAAQNDRKFHGSYGSVLGTYQDIDDLLRSLFWDNIDMAGRTVTVLLSGSQPILDMYDKTFARYASAAWNASPDVGVGTLDEVNSYNKLHSLNTTIPVSAVTAKSMWPLRVDALLGNPQAADALANHYYESDNYSVFFYWKTIAAENGDPAAELFLAQTYSVSSSDDDRTRAAFWAAKAVHDADTPTLVFQSKYAQSDIQTLRAHTPAYMPIPPG